MRLRHSVKRGFCSTKPRRSQGAARHSIRERRKTSTSSGSVRARDPTLTADPPDTAIPSPTVVAGQWRQSEDRANLIRFLPPEHLPGGVGEGVASRAEPALNLSGEAQ